MIVFLNPRNNFKHKQQKKKMSTFRNKARKALCGWVPKLDGISGVKKATFTPTPVPSAVPNTVPHAVPNVSGGNLTNVSGGNSILPAVLATWRQHRENSHQYQYKHIFTISIGIPGSAGLFGYLWSKSATAEFKDKMRLAQAEFTYITRFLETQKDSLSAEQGREIKELLVAVKSLHKSLTSEFKTYKHAMNPWRYISYYAGSKGEKICVERSYELERGLRKFSNLIDKSGYTPGNTETLGWNQTFLDDISRACKEDTKYYEVLEETYTESSVMIEAISARRKLEIQRLTQSTPSNVPQPTEAVVNPPEASVPDASLPNVVGHRSTSAGSGDQLLQTEGSAALVPKVPSHLEESLSLLKIIFLFFRMVFFFH